MVHKEKSKEGIGITELRQRLEDAGIDTSQYGKGVARPVESLLREVQRGESVLLTEDDGTLLRQVVIIGADIYYVTTDAKKFRLKESKQVFSDGRERRRNNGHAVSEKIKPGEDPEISVIRGIQEELGISGAFYSALTSVSEEVRFSQGYPGLVSKYLCYKFEIIFNDEQFNPEGYVERQVDKSTYFTWEEVC